MSRERIPRTPNARSIRTIRREPLVASPARCRFGIRSLYVPKVSFSKKEEQKRSTNLLRRCSR